MRLLAIQVEGLGDSTQLWKNGTRVMFVGSLQVIIFTKPLGTKKLDKSCPKTDDRVSNQGIFGILFQTLIAI